MSSMLRISIMMFLQFFVWGAWFTTLGQALGSNGLVDFIGGGYGSAPLGAIFAPLFLGLIADRFFPSQIVMGVLFILGGIALFFIPGLAAADAAGNGKLIIWLCLAHMLCYMPTLGLGNTVAFSNLDRIQFPKARVWGTIGWIVAGLLVGGIGWSSSMNIFTLAAVASLVLGLFCFALPHTPPPAKGKPLDLKSLFMLDAFGLLKRIPFLVFILCSFLICIPLAYYYAVTSNFLTNAGAEQAASTMSIGQMSEIIFMLLIPFFFRKLGVKWMLFIGMMAWVLRYFLFAYGAPDQVIWMILLGVALHGICYDFFFVTGFMYTDKVAPKAIGSQAQSLLVFFTQGLGMWIGYKIAFAKFGGADKIGLFWDKVKIPVGESPGVPGYGPLNDAMAAAREGEQVGFWEGLTKLFSFNIPEGLGEGLVSAAGTEWKAYWTLPAFTALAIAILFLVTFWDKIKVVDDEPESDEKN